MSKRLLSLDILRGITIAGMIMVNNPGSWGYVYKPLGHAAWHGLTPTDLVFPFFMFIMGVSTYISLRKFNFECTKPVIYKIVKRTVVIFLTGLGLAWLSLSFGTYHRLASEGLAFPEHFFKAITNFGNIRIPGVLQRLALSYGIASLLAITVKHKFFPHIITGGLLGYFIILLFGKGFEFSVDNIIAMIDRVILGTSHLYTDRGVRLDPEGLLSTIPSVCHVMTGFLCGKIILNTQDNYLKINKLFIAGAIMTFAGFLLNYGCPINKKIWSPTFVLVTCGLASTLLALLIWIIDIKGHKKWCVFFESFGVNPLFIYVSAGVLSILLGGIWIPNNGEMVSIKGFIYSKCLQPLLGDFPASLIFALLFVCVNWLIGNILYKKKIYIKI
jgi:predicted acyltransferase